MRYVVKNESVMGHGCCFDAAVLDTHNKSEYAYKDGYVVAECVDIESASMIAACLNEKHEAKHGKS